MRPEGFGVHEGNADVRNLRFPYLAASYGKKSVCALTGNSAVSWAITEKGYSQRRADCLVEIDPHVYWYRSIKPDGTELRNRL